MAFSKTPRVLITDEMSRPGVPGPCDYDPNDASEKRIKGFSIREEDVKKERRQSSGRDPRTDWDWANFVLYVFRMVKIPCP